MNAKNRIRMLATAMLMAAVVCSAQQASSRAQATMPHSGAILRRKKLMRFKLILACIILCPVVFAQQVAKPLTNADVIKMVKGGLPESVVIGSIQSQPGKYDTSPDGLIALHTAGVTQGEMDAMLAVSGKGSTPVGSVPAAAAHSATASPGAAAGSPSQGHLPKVALIQAGASQPLPLEKTQLAQTKTKPSSMKSLSGDSAVTQAMQGGVNTAASGAAMHMNSGVGGSSIQEAGSIFSGVMGHRKPSTTYVWGVPSPASTTIVKTSTPSFAVNYASTMGVDPDDFEPAIVKLTPAQNTCRIVGATQGKEDARSSSAADWQIYSSFLEERVAVNAQKIKPGNYKLAPTAALMPGEYAVVLRPVSKSMKFSGGDVARGQGNGLLFDAVWSFQVSPDAE